MDSKQIRKLNLKLLVREFQTAAKVAVLAESAPSMLSQILSDEGKRDVGDDLARRLESGCFKLHGWMDHIHQDLWYAAELLSDDDIGLLAIAGFPLWGASAAGLSIDELHSSAERADALELAKLAGVVQEISLQNAEILKTLELFRKRFESEPEKIIANRA